MQKIISILCLVAFVTAAQAATIPRQPTEPPVFDETFKGASISVRVIGTFPTSYQWYRGTEANPKKYKVVGAIQREFEPDLATGIGGLYFCEATNAAGSTLSKPIRVSFTTDEDAPELQVIIKRP